MPPTSSHLTSQANLPAQTVLVVEDEVLIRLVLADYLRDCGYRVYEAANADEAVAILQSPEVSVDIVFSDVQMPGGMDGFALAHWVRANQSNVRVILTSGIERSAEIAATLCEAGPMRAKPYPSQDVVDRIRELVSRARQV